SSAGGSPFHHKYFWGDRRSWRRPPRVQAATPSFIVTFSIFDAHSDSGSKHFLRRRKKLAAPAPRYGGDAFLSSSPLQSWFRRST
ncbi:MAG: hypothetical protein IJU71_12985, partial [Selenomonadaceae bacterium]|nr:hypothetical protein [Selenomonadaceae bacterium]